LGIKSDAKLLIQTLIKLSLWMRSESNYRDTLINISSLTHLLAPTAQEVRFTAGLMKGSFSGNEIKYFYHFFWKGSC